MQQNPIHVGIDLAWGFRRRTGLAAVDDAGRLVDSATVSTDREILTWIRRFSDIGVVAFDAPLIVNNADGRRDAEQAITRGFQRFDAGAHTTNLKTLHMDPPRALNLTRELRLRIAPNAHGSRLRTAIEVYPHPAMIGLFGLGRIVKYKHKGQEFDFRQEEMVRLLSLLEGVEPLDLSRVPRWAAIRDVIESANRPSQLGSVEDELDAIFCAHLAWLWAKDSDALVVHAGSDGSFIVAPPSPPESHLATPRRSVAPKAVRAAAHDRPRTSAASPQVSETWRLLEALLDALPVGRWTTYGDVAAALDHYPQPISTRIAKARPGAYWRVIGAKGTVSPNFTWADGRGDSERPVLDHLEGEGVRIDNGRADLRDRLTVDELRQLLTGF